MCVCTAARFMTGALVPSAPGEQCFGGTDDRSLKWVALRLRFVEEN